MLKDMKAKLKSQKGFSLVELIVVIAIMVILVAMLLPSVAGLISSATSASGAQTAASLYTAATTAATANASIPNIDAEQRKTNLTGAGDDKTLSIADNIDASSDDLAKMHVYMDEKTLNVVAVYYEASDGNIYVNPTRFSDADTDSDKSKGIVKAVGNGATDEGGVDLGDLKKVSA